MERVRFIFLWLAVAFIPTQNIFGEHHPVTNVARSNNFTVFEENGRVGLKDEDGEILIPATYEAIGWSTGKLSIVDKVVGYQSNGLWGLIHTSNKVVTEPEFVDLKPGEGSFLVAQKKSTLSQRPSFGIINTSGKTVIPFIYDALQLSNMRAVVMSRSASKYQFGLIDLSHKLLIPLVYRDIYSLGSLRYAVENFEGKTAIFSDDGSQLTPFNIDSISAFKKDYAVLYLGQKQGLIDRGGQMILEPTFGEVQLREDGTIQVRETNSWFLLQGDNQLIKEYRADELKPLSANHYAINTSGKLQLTNNEMKPLHDEFFSSLGEFRNDLALYRKSSGTGIITTEGKVLIPPQYDVLEIERAGFRACEDTGGKNRWVLLDAAGKQITEKRYEYIGPFNGKFYPAKNRGYWGAVNGQGQEVITCVHDSLIEQSHNNIVVKFKGEYGVINTEENWLVTPQRHRLKLVDENAYFELSGKTTFLKSFGGGIIYFSDNPLEYRDGYIREQLASGAYWIIDMSGIIIDRSNQPLLAEKIYPESEGLRAILKDGKYGFIDDMGRLRIANRYEEVKSFSDGLAAIRIRGRWGYIDHHETLVIQPVYDKVGDFDNGKAIVTQDGLSGVIDSSGKTLLPLRYDDIRITPENRLLLRQGNAYGLADASGAVLLQPRYDELVDVGNGYVVVSRDGKFGVVTLRGVSTIPMIYDGLTFDPFHNHFMAVKKSKWKTFRGAR